MRKVDKIGSDGVRSGRVTQLSNVFKTELRWDSADQLWKRGLQIPFYWALEEKRGSTEVM